MGYDMYWVEVPDNGAAKAAADDQFNAAVAERNQFERGSAEYEAAQKKVTVAYHAMDEARPEYFRLNIWGMGSTREAMIALDMLCDPESPSRQDWDEVNARVEALGDDEDSDDIYREILSNHNGECPGIPWWKLSDNSGWYVLPAEIRAALHIYLTKRKDGAEPPELEWWGEWIEWLNSAAEHGGFRVY